MKFFKMKLQSIYILTTTLLLFTHCGNNKTADEAQLTNSSPTESKQEQTEAPSVSGNGIVGEWDQQYSCFDKNGNNKLEPEEKKPSGTRLGFNWFRFNANGTCLRDKDLQFEGTYKIEEKNGDKKLIIEGGDNLRYSLTELTEKELVLGADGAFIVFKRIK
jgi:hypothetical protein